MTQQPSPWRSRRRNPLRRLERRTLRVGGVRTRVHVLTAVGAEVDDAAPSFVLLHGLGLSSRYFVALAESLARHGPVVIFDLPGAGGLPKPRRALTIAEFARVVVAVLAELGVARPVLIGHSMGTQIAVEALAANPGLSRAAVLVGPVVNAEERRFGRVALRFAQSSVFERPGHAAQSVRDYLVSGLTWPNLLLPTLLDYPMEERIASVTADLCLMAGEHDATAPRAWLQRLAAAATRAASTEIVVVDGAAHQVVVGHADVVARTAVALARRSIAS